MPDDDWRKQDPDFTEPRLSEHLRLVERIRGGQPPRQQYRGHVVVAWTLATPAVDGAIVGFRRPGQVGAVVDVWPWRHD